MESAPYKSHSIAFLSKQTRTSKPNINSETTTVIINTAPSGGGSNNNYYYKINNTFIVCVCNINDMCVQEQLCVGFKVLGGDGMQLL